MKTKFLLIDDIQDNLISLQAVLKDAFPDAEVCTARNGSDGLRIARSEDPDVILLDIIMPGMDGFEVCRKLKDDSTLREIPVVILTALQETKENRMKALEAGAEAFLSKPVEIVELTVQLRAMLRIRQGNLKQRDEKDRLSELVANKTADLQKSQIALLNLLDDLKAENENRRKTEKQLRESSVLLNTVMENLPVGIAVNTIDEIVSFEYKNENFLKYYRITEDSLREKGSFWAAVYEDETLRSEMMKRVLEDCASGDPRRMSWEDIPIARDGKTSYVSARNVPIPGKPLMISTVWDVTEHIQARDDNIRSVQQLRKTLAAIVQAMSITVEIRDPYTAGHQRRVAALSRAIAVQMGLSAEQIEGLTMAAQIHDLGKISVPAELLSMPRKLTGIEFSLIKTHSQSGYDILKDIDFPWPIARIILEHHEKSDGSGYPNGLQRDEILIESQILTVADIVEAIASHRPYRPALGIGVALEEISGKSGVCYTRDVVEACLCLFRENRFEFSEGNSDVPGN